MILRWFRQGIALWKFSLQDWHQPKQACRPFMNFLQHPAIDDVSSCSWDPTGQFLAVAGRTDATILVWHVATETVVPLRRVGAGIAKVCWSPDGRYLCAAPNDGDTLRVWDTSNWTNCRAAELATGVTVSNIKSSSSSIYSSFMLGNMLDTRFTSSFIYTT
jgi:WD40 repeat protein